jgi:LDH2 family malate/lactate/ureidoglycolate dehydrogenase
MPLVTADELRNFARTVLVGIGLDEAGADVAGDCLVEANLRGVDSHGVLRLIQYHRSVSSGAVNPRPVIEVTHSGGPTALVDAGGGYGFVPALRAMEVAVEVAGVHGIALVGVRNSHHYGMAALYAERATAVGLIGVAMTNTGPVMAPAGVTRPIAGNNPIAFAVPRRPPAAPIVLDMALSGAAFGRIRLAAAEGRPIPLGWAHDASGEPTTDAAAALAASLLAPMGGHKGYGLSVIVEVLTGILTGSPFGSQSDAHGHLEGGVGHLFVVLRPDLFVAREVFEESVEEFVRELKSAPARAGVEVLVPGEIEQRTRAERAISGVPVSAELVAPLDALAQALGLAIRLPTR